MSPSVKLDAERRAAGNSRLASPMDRDPLYLLIQRRLAARGVLNHTLHWPEIDLAIRDAVEEWRKTERPEGRNTGGPK